MIRIDNSLHDEYHTQINNKRFPFASCNVTSGIMFMKSNKIPYTNPTQEQDEDYFMWRLRQPDAYAKMEYLAPWSIKNRAHIVTNWENQDDLDRRYAHPPSEVWACLAWGINQLAGAQVCRLDFTVSFDAFLLEFVRGRTVICGGKFTHGGHFVNAVGFTTTQEDILKAEVPRSINIAYIDKIIVDDPYGNYLTGYRDHHGNSVEIPRERFLDVAAAYRHEAYRDKNVIYIIRKIAA